MYKAQSICMTKEIRGCFICKSPKLKVLHKGKYLLFHCRACGKTNPRFIELTGPTKVRHTAQGPIHFSAGALIEQNGKYLISKRTHWPFLYATIGGHVDKHETMIKALAREVKEETGLTIKDKQLIFQGLIDPDPCTRGVNKHFWRLYLIHAKGKIKKNPHESIHLRWYTKSQMARLHFTPPVTHIFRKIKLFKK